MVIDQIRQIDQNQDNNINKSELLKAMEPNGFLSKEENLQAVGKLLNDSSELDVDDQILINSLNSVIDIQIKTIEEGNITQEDIKLLSAWKILLGENDKRVQNLNALINSKNNDDKYVNMGLTEQEIINVKEIASLLGINLSAGDIDLIKNTTLTYWEKNNINTIKNLGIDINIKDINKIKDMHLTEQQINNIIKLKNELGIKVCIDDVYGIDDKVLTDEEINRIKKIKTSQEIMELGIELMVGDMVYAKNFEGFNLTEGEKNNIKEIMNVFGIKLRLGEVDKLKNLHLTQENIENIMKIKDALGIALTGRDILSIMDIDFTEIKIDTIIKDIELYKGLGIKIHTWEINRIKNLCLSETELNNLGKLTEKAGISLDGWHIERIKELGLNSLTDENILKIMQIKSFGIDVDGSDIEEIKYIINLTDEEINNIKIITETGIYLSARNIKEIKSRDIGLSQKEIEKIKILRDKFGVYTRISEIEKIKNIELTENLFEKLKKISKISTCSLSISDIENLESIEVTDELVENMQKLKNIGVFVSDIKDISGVNVTDDLIDNIQKLKNIGISVFSSDIKNINDIEVTDYLLENIQKLKQELGIEIDVCDINLLNLEECLNLLKTGKENFYEGYNYSEEEIQLHHHYKKGRIIESIQIYVQSIISENRNIEMAEIIEKIRSDLVTLPAKEKFYIISGVNKVVNTFNTVRNYIDFKKGPYKTPKELLCAMRGITDPKIIEGISGDITVMQHGTGMTFFVGDRKSYQTIYDGSLIDSGSRSGGFNTRSCAIKELEGTLSVVNGENPGKDTEKYAYGTIWHEGQHNWNSYFMSDKELFDPLTRGKDEITAYLREGYSCEGIEITLTRQEKDGGLYQYDLEGEEWENHKRQIKELLGYVYVLLELTKYDIGLTRENVISMLSDTPANERALLYKNFEKSIKIYDISLWLNDYLGIKNIENTEENNNYIDNIDKEFGSGTNNEKTIEDFRWTGNATKENLENEIKNAGSLDELKHILSDPKYSHIGRGPNNKGGIEISAIIDKVVEGKLSLRYIPKKIRSKVKRFINK